MLVTAERERELFELALQPPRYELPGGFQRVYHLHTPKTGGTSLNSAFWSLAGHDLKSVRRRRVVSTSPYLIVRWDKDWIESGNYFFANSHFPAHRLRLPPGTFRVTILRDPVERVVSYYRFTWRDPEKLGRTRRRAEWLGQPFATFLERLPRFQLERHLSMFSTGFDVDEAVERILRCDAVLFTKALSRGITGLSRRLGLPLVVRHERPSRYAFAPSTRDRRLAREALADEYRMMEKVQARLNR